MVHSINLWEIWGTTGLVIVVLSVQYWLGPFLIWRKMSTSAKNNRRVMWFEQLPPEVHEAFRMATPQLVACGFRALAHVRSDKQATKVESSYVSLWVNEATGDSAQAIAVTSRRPDGTLRSAILVTFRREFTDGTRIVTSNSGSPKIFPVDPRTNAISCRNCWDLHRLFAFHAIRARPFSVGKNAVLRLEEDPVEALHRELLTEMNQTVRAGYHTYDAAAERYRPTLKGAFIMTYRLLFPLKQIRLARRDRIAGRELRFLGFGGLTAFRDGTGPVPAMPMPPPPSHTTPTTSP